MLEKIREFLKRIYCNSACCGSTLTVEMAQDKEDEEKDKKKKEKKKEQEQEEEKKDQV